MKHVLVADDSPVVRRIARRILESLRVRTSEAADGRQALEACALSMPDGIFVDRIMPVVDGFEFIRQLRRMPDGEKPTVVFCTSEYDVAQIARALHTGANDILMKPFDREAVKSKFGALGASSSSLVGTALSAGGS